MYKHFLFRRLEEEEDQARRRRRRKTDLEIKKEGGRQIPPIFTSGYGARRGESSEAFLAAAAF